jgi:hypothetical protein
MRALLEECDRIIETLRGLDAPEGHFRGGNDGPGIREMAAQRRLAPHEAAVPHDR